jgi:hypothetical protein
VAGDLPTAASTLRRCLAVARAGTGIRAGAAQNLANALTSTYNTGRTDQSTTRELVQEIQQLGADVPDPTRPTFHYQAAHILRDAYWRWGMTTDLVAADEAVRLALESAPPIWPLAARAHTLTIQFRFMLDGAGGVRRTDDRRRNLDYVVRHAEQALRISTVPPLAPPADQQRVLGAALRLRGLLRGDLNDTRAALELLQAAREQLDGTGDAQSSAHLANDVGLCWKDLRDADPQALDREVVEFEDAQGADADDSDDWLSIRRRNLANHGFDPDWSTPAAVEQWTSRWSRVESYLEQVIPVVALTRHAHTEGAVQAAVSAFSDDTRVMLDREVTPHFRDTAAKESVLGPLSSALVAALERRQPVPAAVPQRFGSECDLLAVDRSGRLLAVEVKPRAPSLVWTPAQATMYARVLQAWVADDCDASPGWPAVVTGMLSSVARWGWLRA